MENEFLKNPRRLYLYDAIKRTTVHAWCLIGDVPAKVASAAGTSRIANAAARSLAQQSTLKEYYGPKWRAKLLDKGVPTDLVDEIKASAAKPDAAAIVGGDPKDTYSDTPGLYDTYSDTPGLYGADGVYGADRVHRADGVYGAAPYVYDATSPHETTHEITQIEPITGGEGDHANILDKPPELLSPASTSDNIDIDQISQLLRTEVGDMSFTQNDLGAIGLRRKISTKTSPPVAPEPGAVDYVRDISVYPEDNLFEFREKIFLITGIPVYRQHLFWITNRIQTTYTLTADVEVICDITDLPTSVVAGIPYDRGLVSASQSIHVESSEIFTLVGGIPTADFFVVDAAQFTWPNQTQLEKILRDHYSLDMIYYGWVMKYFPVIATKECLADFITAESEISAKYPLMSRSRTMVNYMYRAEKQIIDYYYSHTNRVRAMESMTQIAIVNMTLSVHENRCVVDLRNLFDKLRTSAAVPEIHAYIEHDSARWLLRKKFMRVGDIVFPSSAQYKTGIVIAIALRKDLLKRTPAESSGDVKSRSKEIPRYMFLNIHPNGKFYIKVNWHEEENVDFETNLRLVKAHTDGLITSINSLARTVFIVGRGLAQVTESNIVYSGMNIAIMWKKVMPEHAYKALKTLFDPYMRAGMTLPRNVQQFDKFEFTWHKGMHEYDRTLIERIVTASGETNFNNTYLWLTSNLVKQKWDQHYTGRIIRMTHRTTDIRFEVNDIHEAEFEILFRLLLGFMATSITSPALVNSKPTAERVKKLRRLREEDPELFHLKKFGSDKVYSILCQNARQPFIYTPDEIANMSAKQIQALTKYWNFTTKRPAYYSCPNRDYPYLSFITDMHPLGRCLPCCNKKADGVSELKNRIKRECLTTHTFTTGDNALIRHIMGYGKATDLDRLSRVSLLFSQLVTRAMSDTGSDTVTSISKGAKKGGFRARKVTAESYYAIGVAQSIPSGSGHGVTFSLAKILGFTLEEFIADLSQRLIQREDLLHILLRGTLTMYVDSVSQLVDVLRAMYSGELVHTKRMLTDVADLMMELAPALYNLHIIAFIDETRPGASEKITMYVNAVTNQLLRTDFAHHQPYFAFIQKTQNTVMPICYLSADRYFTTGEISLRSFPYGHPIVKLIASAFDSGASAKVPQGKIERVMTTNSGKTYGLIISRGDRTAYFPTTLQVAAGIAPISYQPSDLLVIDLDFRLGWELAHEAGYEAGYQPEELLIHDDISAVRYANGFLGYYKGEAPDVNLPTRRMLHSPILVNATVASGKPPSVDTRQREYQNAMYSHYMYQLLLVEFINFLETDRNHPLRERLYQIILKSRGDFYPAVRALIPGSEVQRAQDLATLHKQITDYTYGHYSKQFLINTIAHTVYEFDKITVNKLRKMDADAKRTEIARIVKTITTPGELTDGIFPNIYIPCGGEHQGKIKSITGTPGAASTSDTTSNTTSDTPNSADEFISLDAVSSGTTDIARKNFTYCKRGRLILNSPEDFIDILTSDFTSSLKLRYILNTLYADSAAEFFKFTTNPMEDINIYKL